MTYMVPSPSVLIIFDCSGTLLDDTTPVYLANCDLCVQYEVPVPTYEEWMVMRSNSLDDFIAARIPSITGATALEEAISYFKDRYSTHQAHSFPTMCSNAKETLSNLSAAGCALVMVSAHIDASLRHELESHGLLYFFDDVYGGVSDKASVIKRVKNSYGLARTYYVGDTTGDITAACLAGVTSINMTTGYHSRTALTSHMGTPLGDGVIAQSTLIDDLSELPRVIRSGGESRITRVETITIFVCALLLGNLIDNHPSCVLSIIMLVTFAFIHLMGR